MTNEELRKELCEALGWIDISHHAEPLTGEGEKFMMGCNPAVMSMTALPHFESDPGVFWPEFEKWRLEHDLNYECGSDSRGNSLSSGDTPRERLHYFKVLDDAFNDFMEREEGETLIMAGARAWLAALKAMQ